MVNAMTQRIRNSNDALTKEQVKQLLASVDNVRDQIMIKMGIYSGCRINELRNLRIDKIDWINSTIIVWDNKHNKWAYKKELNTSTGKRIKDYKTSEGKWRVVAIPQWLMKELKSYIEDNPSSTTSDVRLDQYGQPDGGAGGKTYYVWPFYYITWERALQKWTSRVLHTKKSWHCLRHTYMSLHRESGSPIEYVMKQTGDSGQTIYNVYSQVSPDGLKKHTEKDLLT